MEHERKEGGRRKGEGGNCQDRERERAARFGVVDQQATEFSKPAVVTMVERPRPGRIDYFEKYGSYRKVPAAVSR